MKTPCTYATVEDSKLRCWLRTDSEHEQAIAGVHIASRNPIMVQLNNHLQH